MIFLAILSTLLVHLVSSQENAATSLANSLTECYNNSLLTTRDYRLPLTTNVLIDLIRKMEEGNPSINSRTLSLQILHRFRQDGIEKDSTGDIGDSVGIPFSPKGKEAFKNRVQLETLTPGNALNFNNKSLNILERCSLHSMISSTIARRRRGDEDTVCSRLSRYTSRIQKRETEIEQLDTNKFSACPVESGVIYSKWGTVKAGTVLAGIAAGFSPVQIPNAHGAIDNRFASTLAGELSEVALYERQTLKKLGNSGGWNSTLVPHYYFLEKADKDFLYVTDAEIRGGLDGLYLALNINNWKSKVTDLKISQILDLYYSQRGVFNKTIRACNRKILRTSLAPTEILVKQITSFNYLLDAKATYSFTPDKNAFPLQAKNTMDAFNSYIASLNDVGCDSSENLIERVATDILIFLDTQWSFNVIQPLISSILDNIDVNRFETSYSVFTGEGTVIVNKSRHISDFFEAYNESQHSLYQSGFDYNKVVTLIEEQFKAKLNNETDLTGQSTIALLLPHGIPTEDQKQFAQNKRNTFKQFLPDLKILVAGTGSKESYSALVSNPTNDVFIVSDNSDEPSLRTSALNIVERLSKIPRNVVNPECKTQVLSHVNNFNLDQFVEPEGLNIHKISPQYFVNAKTLKIRGEGYGNTAVCMSRTDANPRANVTANGENCKNIATDEISFDISGYCGGSPQNCLPIYISVQGLSSNVRCNDPRCRFPDSIKYTLTVEGGSCPGGGAKLIANIMIVATLFVTLRF